MKNARNLFFPHDAYSARDEKILALRLKYKWEGYGLYFAILERLLINDGYSTRNYALIGFDLRSDTGLIKSIIEDFGLFAFTEDGECFYSKRLLDQISAMQEKSEKARASAEKRWNKTGNSYERNANALPTHNDRNAKKNIKEKNTKEDNNNTLSRSSSKELEEQFELFRKKYPGSKRGHDFEFNNFKKKYKNWHKIVPLLDSSLDKLMVWHNKKLELNQFCPEYASLTKWINQARWEEELEPITHKPLQNGNNQQPTQQLSNEPISNGGRTDTL